MNPRSEAALLAAYRAILRTRILNTRPGYKAFERCYDRHQASLEASSIRYGVRQRLAGASTDPCE